MHRTLLLAAVAALLTGCVEVPTVTEDPDACRASGLQGLVGQREAVLESMIFPASRVRVIRPGMAVTTDYSVDRLNFDIDSEGRIARVYCG